MGDERAMGWPRSYWARGPVDHVSVHPAGVPTWGRAHPAARVLGVAAAAGVAVGTAHAAASTTSTTGAIALRRDRSTTAVERLA